MLVDSLLNLHERNAHSVEKQSFARQDYTFYLLRNAGFDCATKVNGMSKFKFTDTVTFNFKRQTLIAKFWAELFYAVEALRALSGVKFKLNRIFLSNNWASAGLGFYSKLKVLHDFI